MGVEIAPPPLSSPSRGEEAEGLDIMEDNLVIHILAGGVGTRFWPVSTDQRPKQFLKIFGDRSLLQQTYDRALKVASPDRIVVLTNRQFCGLVRDQLPNLPASNVIGEPFRRDTAAAVALSCLLAQKRHGNPVIAILTADHVIEPEEAFLASLHSAATWARRTGILYTFGIRPTTPSTGYGYLELGERVAEDGPILHHKILRFRGKPNLETAIEFVESGRYLWNSGMFVWTAEAMLRELALRSKVHLDSLGPVVSRRDPPDWEVELAEAFERLPSISIDFAVMEKASEVRTVAATFSWKDLGGWLSVEAYLDKDGEGNAFRGRLCTVDAHSNLAFSEDPEEIISLIGVDNLVVIRSGKTTLVVPKGRTEEVKVLVKKMES